MLPSPYSSAAQGGPGVRGGRCAAAALSVLFAWAGIGALPADVIVLRNGKRILAPVVREEGARVTYETEDGTYSLPRSLVLRIEKEAGPAASTARPVPRDAGLPPLAPAPERGPAPLLPNGELDRDYLDAAARQPPAQEAARKRLAALLLAAIDYELQRGKSDSAMSLAQKALSAFPQDPQLALSYGVLLLHKQQYQLARDWLNRASLAAPDSPDVWKFLGFAEYFSDRTGDAIRCWRRSLSLAPDSGLEGMLERALRETAAEVRHEQASSNHFTLRFEGRQVPPDFRRAILDVLERHYSDLERQLGAWLREPIAVILYTEQAFRDVTRVPSWAGAVNDGRVRVPVDGLSSVTPELSAVLRHELVHSFLWARAGARCPVWLNEGLAQLLQGNSAGGERRLVELWRAGKLLPWPMLEKPFLGLGPGLAWLAYAQSLAAAEFLVARHGLPDMVRLLERLAGGGSVEAALSGVYRMNYRDLEQAVGDWLR